ncbi:DUF4388 domain-containing protein [candidate division WOR-3 bacterium]|nr:DUF4388 domain-containing protein [candidate division WOR-3 bacterium]
MVRAKKGMKNFHGLFALHFLNLLRSIKNSKQTLSIDVNLSDKESGAIYFNKGELVHAECNGIIGEEAFIKILESRDGKYIKRLEATADVISIERDIRDILTDYNQSKSRDQEMPHLTFPEMEEIPDFEGAEWSPPEAPKHGLQEEAWISDWGKRTTGFNWARITKPDGGRVMGVADENIDVEGLEELLAAVTKFFGKDEGQRYIFIQSGEDFYVVSSLLEGYLIVINVMQPEEGIEEFKEHLALLVKALNNTLTRA